MSATLRFAAQGGMALIFFFSKNQNLADSPIQAIFFILAKIIKY
jgi:hypothetical protein